MKQKPPTDNDDQIVYIPGVVSNREPYQGEPISHGPTPDQIYDCENNVEPARTIAQRIASNYQITGEWRDRLIDNISHAVEDAMAAGEGRATARHQAHVAELEAQLQAEGEHTAAANANIDRLNTEIERVTRRQQGPLMGKY